MDSTIDDVFQLGSCLDNNFDDQTCRRLVTALFLQAIRDAMIKGDKQPQWMIYIRDEARAWLIDCGEYWAAIAGFNIKKAEFAEWIKAGCPKKRGGQFEAEESEQEPEQIDLPAELFQMSFAVE